MYIIFFYLLGVGLPIITIHNCPIKLRALTPPSCNNRASSCFPIWQRAGQNQKRVGGSLGVRV